jgi:(p)ppGpp synthase/HD superfamily hydrolase
MNACIKTYCRNEAETGHLYCTEHRLGVSTDASSTPKPVPTLEDAIIIATNAHFKQVDKSSEPYILHVLRCLLNLGRRATETERIVAVLHDVVEDTDWTLKHLEEARFSQEVLAAVETLTHLPNEPYTSYIDRIALNPLAIKVKLADLKDNMDPERIENTGYADAQRRWAKYGKAHYRLTHLDPPGEKP